ncbi:MAG: hypothetical protein R3F11_11805 [Verrucomicrobiales bacterium]
MASSSSRRSVQSAILVAKHGFDNAWLLDIAIFEDLEEVSGGKRIFGVELKRAL